jgi:hypothetical protein
MEWEEHREKAVAFVADAENSYPKDDLDRALSNALYTFSELGLWKMDIDIKGTEEAIRVWAVVEAVRRAGEFPSNLTM